MGGTDLAQKKLPTDSVAPLYNYFPHVMSRWEKTAGVFWVSYQRVVLTECHDGTEQRPHHCRSCNSVDKNEQARILVRIAIMMLNRAYFLAIYT